MGILGSNCSECSGLEACTRYCALRAGEGIVNFINNLDYVDTLIGEIRNGANYNSTKPIVVCGYMVSKNAAPCDLMTEVSDSGTIISAKFCDCMGVTPVQALRTYLNTKGFDGVSSTKAVKHLNNFMSNRMIPVPFKIGNDIEIMHKGYEDREKRVHTTIKVIKWKVDKESGKLIGTIFAEVGKIDDRDSYSKVKISDYGKTWFFPNIERNLKTNELYYDTIKMTDDGLIHPIEITDGNTIVAVDSQHMYLHKSGIDYILGTWGNNGMIENNEYVSKIKNEPTYIEAKKRLRFIERHKRFIIPYKLQEANIIRI